MSKEIKLIDASKSLLVNESPVLDLPNTEKAVGADDSPHIDVWDGGRDAWLTVVGGFVTSSG